MGDMVKIHKIITKEEYLLFICFAIHLGNLIIGEPFIFQENINSKHTSKLCRNYFSESE